MLVDLGRRRAGDPADRRAEAVPTTLDQCRPSGASRAFQSRSGALAILLRTLGMDARLEVRPRSASDRQRRGIARACSACGDRAKETADRTPSHGSPCRHRRHLSRRPAGLWLADGRRRIHPHLGRGRDHRRHKPVRWPGIGRGVDHGSGRLPDDSQRDHRAEHQLLLECVPPGLPVDRRGHRQLVRHPTRRQETRHEHGDRAARPGARQLPPIAAPAPGDPRWRIWIAALLFLAGTLHSSNFATGPQLQSILIYAAFIGIIGFGQTLCILTGGIDLSVPWTLTGFGRPDLGARTWTLVPAPRRSCSWFSRSPLSFGLVNGIGIAYFGVPPIIMTLGMNGALQGLLLVYTNGGISSNASNCV